MNRSWADYFEQSFLGHVYLGKFHWDLLRDFPLQTVEAGETGDRACESVLRFIDEYLDEARLGGVGVCPGNFLRGW